MAVSAAGLQSEVVASAAFTTLRHIGPLTLEFDDEETPRIESGEQFTIVPAVGGGDEPYVYSWTDQMGRRIGTESTLTVNPEVSQSYMLKVESADGQAVEAKTAVEVTGDMAVATFDDNYVAEDSHITPETEEERFYSGSFAFNAGGVPEYSFWYGYALSSETSPESSGLDDQFRSAPGGAFSGSNFAVGYPQGLTIDVTNDPEGAVVPGLYVSNSAYALSSNAPTATDLPRNSRLETGSSLSQRQRTLRATPEQRTSILPICGMRLLPSISSFHRGNGWISEALGR